MTNPPKHTNYEHMKSRLQIPPSRLIKNNYKTQITNPPLHANYEQLINPDYKSPQAR